MKGFRSVLNEFWNGTIVEAKLPVAKIVKSEFTKERPKVPFERFIKYHELTPQIQIAVSSYSELITGTEMVLKTKGKEAQEFLDEWVRKNGFYDKFEGLVTTLLITGNALFEKLDKTGIDDVQEVDMSTIMAKKRDENGKTEYYEQRQEMGKMVKLNDVDKFIEFNLTHYSNQDWGRSLFYSLAIPRTTGFRTTAPLAEIMWGMEDAMGGIYLNNAYPITTITYPGANDEYLEREAERWRRFKPGDKRVQKIKPEIEFFESQGSQSKFTELINHMEKVFELGTQFPHDIMTGDFTSRASSETTESIVMKRVRGFQRYLCTKLKRQLFEVILEQNGFNPEDEELEISFTTQNIVELQPDQVMKLFTDKVISLKEVREWFMKNTGMDLTDKELKDLIAQADFQKDAQMMMQQRDGDKKLGNAKQNFGKELKAKEEKINELQNKLLVRESSHKHDKVKITKEILEDLKNL